MVGSVEKQIQNALGSLPPCGNRCRFSESAICSSRVHPPSEIKSDFKFKALRWRPLRWRLTLSDFWTDSIWRHATIRDSCLLVSSRVSNKHLPPSPKSKIGLWVPKSTVDTQIFENNKKFSGISKPVVWGTVVCTPGSRGFRQFRGFRGFR